MPPQIGIIKVGLKSTEPAGGEAREAKLSLMVEIAVALRSLGYQLDTASLSLANLQKDDEMRYEVDDLQKRFDGELQVMRKKPKDVCKGRFSLGDEVAKLPFSENADALLFVRARGTRFTADVTVLEFGLVDPKTGTILYFARSKMLADILEDSDTIAENIRKAFSDLPQKTPLPPPYQPTQLSSAGSDETPQNPQPMRIRLSQAAMKGMLVKGVRPEYPRMASDNNVEGTVELRIVIDVEGKVSAASAISGPLQLRQAAVAAVRQWRFRPYVLEGQLVEVETHLLLNFFLTG